MVDDGAKNGNSACSASAHFVESSRRNQKTSIILGVQGRYRAANSTSGSRVSTRWRTTWACYRFWEETIYNYVHRRRSRRQCAKGRPRQHIPRPLFNQRSVRNSPGGRGKVVAKGQLRELEVVKVDSSTEHILVKVSYSNDRLGWGGHRRCHHQVSH